MAVCRIEPPITSITDAIRLRFHELTGLILPKTICQTCWLNIVALFTQAIEPDAILKYEHMCPHHVEADLVLYHSLEGLPQEDYWLEPDPWSDSR